MSNENYVVFLFSGGFPFESKEQHLHSEIPFLEKGFKEIKYVTTSGNLIKPITDAHIPVKHVGASSREWLKRLKYGILLLCTLSFYKELFALVKMRKMSLYKIKILVHHYFNSRQIVSVVAAHIRSNWEHYHNKKILFYAYWTDEKAMACIFLKRNFKNSFSISRIHGWDVYEERHRENYLPWRNFIFTNLDQVFCISKNGFDYLIARYPSFKKSRVMRLGTKPLEHLELKKTTDLFRILSVSGVIPLKRLDKIVRALQICGDSMPGKVHWTHVGSGSDLPKINNLAKELLDGKCSYEFKGLLQNEELRKLISSTYFDLFINVSETEGLPVSIMEAMSAAIPVLATDVGGTSEIVNARNGWLVHKNVTDEELAKVICQIINTDPKAMEKKREEAFNTFNTQFNSDLNHSAFVDYLINCVMK
jgi:glycosyltransferase involved in cell wall biosynthesis